MNRSILDVRGGILLVSNFTLHGDCRKSRRPSFDAAREPALAQQPAIRRVADLIAGQGMPVEKGVFGAHTCRSAVSTTAQ